MHKMLENCQCKCVSGHQDFRRRGRQRCSEPSSEPESSSGRSPPLSCTCNTRAPRICARAPLASLSTSTSTPSSHSAPCSSCVKTGSSRRCSASSFGRSVGADSDVQLLLTGCTDAESLVLSVAVSVFAGEVQVEAGEGEATGGLSAKCVGDSANRCTPRSLPASIPVCAVALRTFETESHSVP